MNKKVPARIENSEAKRNALIRLVSNLQRLQKKFSHINVSVTFGRLSVFRKAQIYKFAIMEKIKTRKIQQAFLESKVYQKKSLNNKRNVRLNKNLAFSVLVRFFKKKQENDKCQVFLKFKQLAVKFSMFKSTLLIQSIIKISSSFKRRTLLGKTLQKLNNVHFTRRKISKFFTKIELYIKLLSKSHLENSFSLIMREAFRQSQLQNMKRKQQKILVEKNQNLNRNETIRSLKTQILNLSKALQSQQAVRNRTKKQDYEKNLVLQAKTCQKNKNAQELERATYQYSSLNFQLSKKQGYLRLRQQEKKIQNDSLLNWKNLYELLRSQKTKESFGMKEFSIILQRNGLDLTQGIKKFSLSKDNTIIENIDLRNLVILYEKQMPGFGASVNIKESQTYKKTMQQNVNLRQVLQILLLKVLQAEQRLVSTSREELKAVVEGHNSSQKGSKLTLTTVSTSPF